MVAGWGNGGTEGNQAFKWTAATGLVGLGDLPGGITSSVAQGMSDNGSVIVGRSYSTNGSEAFRWSEAGGMIGLGDLPGGTFESYAFSVSADGCTIVGRGSASTQGSQAFRWTAGEGMVGLGYLPGPSYLSEARDVSGDGAVIVGFNKASLFVPDEAFVWDRAHGMRSLKVVLAEAGAEVTGWQLNRAYAISDDGRSVAGIGINPSA